MLPVHDHNARASTQIAAHMGLATIMLSCDANGSGWHREVLLVQPSLVETSVNKPNFGFLPRFAA
ncbi:MAG: hypothetical protein H0T76_21950 [Nannocystis sp.]|nr:hypothetical protein [Nannocystis sp.]MBA3549144.1 hypothetical protein [Nannocystis sp.]